MSSTPLLDSKKTPSYPPLPPISQGRLDASVADSGADAESQTKLYLAYGSNLDSKTFRGVRGVRPLACVNVVVPSLRLTFDLPGLPYAEPCFANSAWRDEHDAANENGHADKADGAPPRSADRHRDRWHKGLVGCVYEVTAADYARIQATEGGGAVYHDVTVACHALAADVDTVPTTPTTPAFRAHALLAPGSMTTRVPGFAQPSARYRGLIITGAAEVALPAEYQAYLAQLRAFRTTTWRQRWGGAVFLATWVPPVLLLMRMQKRLADDRGRAPPWIAALHHGIRAAMWTSYDYVFKPLFGDGERTADDAADDAAAVVPRVPSAPQATRAQVLEAADAQAKPAGLRRKSGWMASSEALA